jgi:hypothetical protein
MRWALLVSLLQVSASVSVRHGEKVGIVGRPALASLPAMALCMFDDLAVRFGTPA